MHLRLRNLAVFFRWHSLSQADCSADLKVLGCHAYDTNLICTRVHFSRFDPKVPHFSRKFPRVGSSQVCWMLLFRLGTVWVPECVQCVDSGVLSGGE